MFDAMKTHLACQIDEIKEHGLFKEERVLTGPQGPHVQVDGVGEVLNFCSNNYLGLANHPDIIAAAEAAHAQYGYGLSSVRFICGTQRIHKDLEKRLSGFLGTEDTILYSSCFDANGGLFETLLSEEDAVISDELNHASIIDGIRLCKAQRYRYKPGDMTALEECLRQTHSARFRLIATDGVFSMDGAITNLPAICDLAERYGALVMVDDSHGVGVLGQRGRGTHEHHGVMDRIDILTGTLGKALGGATGGYTSGRQEIIDILRQRSRPYLFSNTLAPGIAAAAIKAIDIVESSPNLLDTLRENTRHFRENIAEAGLTIPKDQHPIVPIILGDAQVAKQTAARLLENGIYVTAFSYPVVPQGTARIRLQISAAHTKQDLDKAIQCWR